MVSTRFVGTRRLKNGRTRVLLPRTHRTFMRYSTPSAFSCPEKRDFLAFEPFRKCVLGGPENSGVERNELMFRDNSTEYENLA